MRIQKNDAAIAHPRYDRTEGPTTFSHLPAVYKHTAEYWMTSYEYDYFITPEKHRQYTTYDFRFSSRKVSK